MSQRRFGPCSPSRSPCCAVAIPAAAQDSGTIRMVVPFGPGTTTDSVGRVVADGLGKALKQNVVVDNRAGAGGTTGSDQVAKSAPDGRTLVMGTVGTHAINATLFRKMPYDTLRDFAPVAFIGYTPTLLVVSADSPARTLKDIAAMAARRKASPSRRPATARRATSPARCWRNGSAAR